MFDLIVLFPLKPAAVLGLVKDASRRFAVGFAHP
jgi:hypothetical protein